MQTSRKHGMITLNDALLEVVDEDSWRLTRRGVKRWTSPGSRPD